MAEPLTPGTPTKQAIEAWRNWPSESQQPPDVLDGRFPILDVEPSVESGRRPAKAVEGEAVTVSAVVFREGHDLLGVDVVFGRKDGKESIRSPMTPTEAGLDRWSAQIRPEHPGEWSFTIHAWADPIGTWQHRAQIKIPADIDVELELLEGALIMQRASDQMVDPANRKAIDKAVKALKATKKKPLDRLAAAMNDDVMAALRAEPLRDLESTNGPWPLRVDRRRALFGSWYEFFPRSEGATGEPSVSGSLATAARRLPELAQMGFDVIYLPPIHPIGRINRKGPNNYVDAQPGDPGSPWAVGADEGGHDTVHPDLGTLADFDSFVQSARTNNLEVALDLALQVAPDHPWATEGRPWFLLRADGTIAYAENPPKKYQDIYPIWFDGDPEGLYEEVLRIIHFWADRGVRIFRVDNPHTKPIRFWDRLLNEVHRTDPDILFLAEAFTRPPMMRALAEVGFHQSYSYFTWRTEKWEIEEYFTQLSDTASAYMRPNLFVNTPDILHAYLQYGGPAAFAIRATLAATLAPTWGVYAGFELYEHVAVKPGSEEYLDSEKYQLRPRDWAGAAAAGKTLAPYITTLNLLRRQHRALQTLRDITFHPVDNDKVIAYSRRDGDDIVIVVCTLDPYGAQEATVDFDMEALGMDWSTEFTAHDHIGNSTWRWSPHTYVRIDPYQACAHIVSIRKGTE
ncbi:MAG: maltotransferase domain-containing protein [Candidatus Nanopelagicales bacterium]